MLHVTPVCTPCCMMLRVFRSCCGKFETGQSFKPTFLLFRDRRSVALQCWIRLHSSSKIDGATHAHCTWFTKSNRLYPSHLRCTAGPSSVGSYCNRLHNTANTDEKCWELLRPFARSFIADLKTILPVARLGNKES